MQPKDEITLVAPNGARFEEKFNGHKTVGNVLEHAVNEFGKKGDLDPKQSYVLVLGNRALENSLTLEQAGVKPGDILKVRSKQIPGDGHASRV